jgi:hypothetical protein
MVRLYQSPAQGKRRFLENESDISAGRSPVCGAAVLGRLLPLKSSSSGLTDKRGQATDFVSVHPKKGLFQPGLSYESIDGSSTYSGGRKSPESTESSTSTNSSQGEDGLDDDQFQSPESFVLQFEPRQQPPANKTPSKEEPLPTDESSDRQQLRMNRLQSWVAQQQDDCDVGSSSNRQSPPAATPSAGFIIRNKANIWSTNLPVVTEESSFEMEDSSQASGGAAGTNAKEGSQRAEGAQPLKNVRSYSSPEKNEMLLAMRQLVLKQQSALTEMAEENCTHRSELQECRQLLELAKQTCTRQQRRMEAFTVEKDSADAEVLWLREEVKTLRTEIQKQQQPEAKKKPWTLDKSAEQVEDSTRLARSETPEARRGQFQTPPRRHESLVTEATPAPSPVTSPAQTWRFKNILPEVKDSSSESDDELVKEFRSLRQTLKGAGISTEAAELQLRERQRRARAMPDVRESRDEQPDAPSNMAQQHHHHHTRVGSPGMPEDELREWNRSRSPLRPTTQRPTTQAPQQITTDRGGQSPFRKLDSSSWRPREAPRALSEVSAGSSSSMSAASSMVSQRSREEVALFKNRLEAIQKKREHRKQIEETVGSRSGRVRFT